jgi:hypothetical protein
LLSGELRFYKPQIPKNYTIFRLNMQATGQWDRFGPGFAIRSISNSVSTISRLRGTHWPGRTFPIAVTENTPPHSRARTPAALPTGSRPGNLSAISFTAFLNSSNLMILQKNTESYFQAVDIGTNRVYLRLIEILYRILKRLLYLKE